MNMKKKVVFYILIIGLLFLGSPFINAQTESSNRKELLSSDSLTLKEILSVVILNHPSVKEAEEILNETDYRINNAKSGYYPNVDISASYAHIGPVPSVSLGDQSFAMAPSDNIGGALNFRQTIYDFGRTSRSILLEKENQNIESVNVSIVKQRLTMNVINTFYALTYLQDALQIKNKDLESLQDHLEFVKKQQITGTATKYEILATQVRISSTESQKIDLETLIKSQRVVMDMLAGMPSIFIPKIKRELNIKTVNISSDSLVNYGFSQRVDLASALEKEKKAELQYNLMKTTEMPLLSFIASGGGKNGYFPDLGIVKANYLVGLDLRIPLFDGYRKKNNLALAKSYINTFAYETELTKRNINNEIVEADANKKAAEKKIKQFEIQLELADEAFSMAKTKYANGTITNLEMLDMETAVSDSRLLLMKANIDYILSIYRMRIAIGDKLYDNL